MGLGIAIGSAIGWNRPTTGGGGGGGGAPEPPPLVGYDTDIYAAVIDVDTGGAGDYTSLQAAEAGERLLNNAKKVAFVCRASGQAADATDVNFQSGFWGTTEVEVWQAQSDRHVGVWDDTKYRLDGGKIQATVAILVDGIQISDNTPLYIVVTAMNVVVRNCLLRSHSGSSFHNVFQQGGGVTKVYNCVFYQGGTSSFADVIRFQYTSGTHYISNCTIYSPKGGSIGIDPDNNANVVATNVLVTTPGQSFSTVGSNEFSAAGSANNASNDATAPGDGSRQSQTFTFEDAGSEDFRLASLDAGAKGYGTASGDAWDYGYDIAGNPWNGLPSIGANEPQ